MTNTYDENSIVTLDYREAVRQSLGMPAAFLSILERCMEYGQYFGKGSGHCKG